MMPSSPNRAPSERVLVTGGAGFIGSHLVRRLLSEGLAVRVLDDLSTGRASNLVGLPVELLVGDVRLDAEQAVEGCTRVFHLAARSSVPDSIEDPGNSFATNALGTSRILEAARLAGVERVTLASTAAVYGSTKGQVSERTPCRPVSPYAAEKAAGELLAQAYSRSFDLDVVALRLFNVYGPCQDPESAYSGVIAAFCGDLAAGRMPTIHGDGTQSRDFVHVRDVVEAFLVADARGTPGAVYNVGTGREATVLEVLRALQQAVGAANTVRFVARRAGDLDRSCADISRLAALGYEPAIPLGSGLAETWRWYEAMSAPA